MIFQLLNVGINALSEGLKYLPKPPIKLRISIGGGWPLFHQESPLDIVSSLYPMVKENIIVPLMKKDCSPEIAIEHGEVVVGPVGCFVGLVHSVKKNREYQVIILDSPWVINPKYKNYPVSIYFEDNGRLSQRQNNKIPTHIYGAANSPADPVNLFKHLSPVKPGDIAVIHNCGAYISSLISTFNSRAVPPVKTFRF